VVNRNLPTHNWKLRVIDNDDQVFIIDISEIHIFWEEHDYENST
jgi:hypothetical protein